MAEETGILPFQRDILQTLHDPLTSELLILARGLGLRKIVCTLLKIYDSPQNLVLLVNTQPEENASIGEELGIMGCTRPGLRIVGYEMGRKDRQNLYKQGGLITVTSQILVVDLLQSDIPVDLVTGLVVMHAEKVTALSLEAFIIRLFREGNQAGFVKAFTDEPEHITSGLYPLKSIMKELQLRKVHIYPRFHEEIKTSLERRKADVIELYQPLTEPMSEIHQAIVQCMSATLSELKRSNTTLELEDFNVENAYFKSFDSIVRRLLDPVWHKVAPKTKQLVSDLGTLRNLLSYLLSYDCLAFHAYLETIMASNSTTVKGAVKVHQSPWLFMDAANTIFQTAKRRCYLSSAPNMAAPTAAASDVIDLVEDEDNDDEDVWEALYEAEGRRPTNYQPKASPEKKKKRSWLPKGMEPVLEELPKWSLLADVLYEIEEEMMRLEATTSSLTPGTNTVLVMCSSQRTCDILSEFLSSLDTSAEVGEKGKKMMERRLRLYLWWKGKLSSNKKEGKGIFQLPATRSPATDGGPSATSQGSNSNDGNDIGISDALKRKDAVRKERLANRRRIRGGGPSTAGGGRSQGSNNGSSPVPSLTTAQESAMSSKEREKLGIMTGEGDMRIEAENIADFLASQPAENVLNPDELSVITLFGGATQGLGIDIDEEVAMSLDTMDFETDFDTHFGLLEPQQTIVVRPYSDDSDDRLLAELRPRFIVMYEPNQDFIRRIECYRSGNPGLAVRVYFMVYQFSCEEHKYLAGIRREKDAFERLIKERGSMLIPIMEDARSHSSGDTLIRTISTRIAGGAGSKQLNTEPSQVIVDMREFRSTLPSLLHASKVVVVPATLTVGDYILTPDICVERKSIPDLMSSFNSGRLYTQCELMSVHYKQPILLIEFEENKSFSLETIGDLKSYVKPTSKYPQKKKPNDAPSDPNNTTLSLTSIQSKIVLLTLSFPRLRIVWSSSPYASADIFKDLKTARPEPNLNRAVALGAEEDPDAGAGVNAAAEELLQALPGVTSKNVKYVMSKVRSVRELCELDKAAVQEILGIEPGKACWEFMHRGE